MPTDDVITPLELRWEERTFPIYTATPVPEGEEHPRLYNIDYLIYEIDPSTPECSEVLHPYVRPDQAFDVHIVSSHERAVEMMEELADRMADEGLMVFDGPPDDDFEGSYVVISSDGEDAVTTKITHNGKDAWVFDISFYRDPLAFGLIRVFDWTKSFPQSES